MESMLDLLRGRRSYRRFLQTPVAPAVTSEMIEAARIASSAANRQVLKYVLVQSPAMVAQLHPLVRWAAYLPAAQGTPAAAEQPVLYVVVLQDESIPGAKAGDTDAGLALGSMTAVAWSHGVGSCILGAIDRPAIAALLGLADHLHIRCVLACGFPAHKSKIVPVENGSIQYYLDDARDYCVPKRPTEEILVKTV